MKITRPQPLVTDQYSLDEYTSMLMGDESIDKNESLVKACAIAWDIKPASDLPSSLAVALLLNELGTDKTTKTVALLSSSSQSDEDYFQSVHKNFGKDIASMVRNVCWMHGFQTTNLQDNSPEQAERIRRLLLSMVDDVRVVLVKLAYRVQRLRELSKASESVRYNIARESMDIFAPIANRLGIGQLKWEMEDLSFRFLEPQTYKRIAKLLEQRREEREDYIVDFVDELKQMLADINIEAEVYGRPKHIYSIWKKMTSKSRDFHELFDVRAVRVVVDSISDCYLVLGQAHGHWRHIEKEFDDYIANPKENGYQSLHTAVHGPRGQPVEIQIRTRQMNEFAEHGVAAHWHYKEGGTGDRSLEDSVASLRKLLDPGETRDDELLDSFHTEIFNDRVFVLTPNGKVMDLPVDSTPIDFAYAVHTEVGHRCRGAKVNGHIVPLHYKLKNSEQVEILTAKNPAPSRDWLTPHLGYIRSNRARNRVRNWFRLQDFEINLEDGKTAFERELKRQNIRNPDHDDIVKHLKMKNMDDVYSGIGSGKISNTQIAATLHALYSGKETRLPVLAKKTQRKSRSAKAGGVIVRGVGNLLTNLANCCKPVPGDEITGFITRGKGVSIHRCDCRNIINIKEENRSRLIEVEWGEDEIQTYPVSILIDAIDRHGLLSDITQMLADEKVNIIKVNTLSDKSRSTAKMTVVIEISDLQQLNRIMDKMDDLPNVVQVSRGSHH